MHRFHILYISFRYTSSKCSIDSLKSVCILFNICIMAFQNVNPVLCLYASECGNRLQLTLVSCSISIVSCRGRLFVIERYKSK